MKTIASLKKNLCAIHLVEGTNNSLHVMVEDKEGLTDFPLKYQDETIAYDNPERYPQYIKNLVPFMFEVMEALQFARKYPGLHSYSTIDNHYTEKRIQFLADNGLVKVNEFSQFEAV